MIRNVRHANVRQIEHCSFWFESPGKLDSACDVISMLYINETIVFHGISVKFPTL